MLAPGTIDVNSPQPFREHAERNLSVLVITVEFTLISVMIGVILFPLMDHAKDLLANLEYEYWLYILSGLLFVLYLWTEVISHSLSFIGWPLEFGHNLLYIVFALLLAVQMNFLSDPRAWFALTLVNTLVAATIVIYDLRVIEKKRANARPRAAELFALVLKRQQGLLRVMPLTLLNAFVPLTLMLVLPAIFIEQHGHLILVALQILVLLALLIRTIQTFTSWAEPILAQAAEELQLEETR